MALIEIDGLPFLIAWVDLSMANCECHSQMVIFYMVDGEFFFNVHQPFLMVNNHGWLYIYIFITILVYMVIYSQYIYIIWLCTYIGNIQKTTSTIHDIYGNPNIDQ